MSILKVPTNKKTVYVGMSGGVDSSVSAALLKKTGYRVVGVFIRPWDPTDDKEIDWGISCNWRSERREAMRAAAHLDIPLLTFDASVAYKQKVVDYLLGEYRAGRTPNPDVMCNKQIKFGVFYDWAMSQGADFVATGHYAQLTANGYQLLALKRKNKKRKSNEIDHRLLISKDKNKDQTYFLWNLRQDQLAHILFPVGDYQKEEVRKLAQKFGLPNAEKKDSQGLCFIGQIDFKKFLSQQISSQPGQVLNEKGEAIGHHAGAVFLTIGERHGFVLDKKTPDQKPYFVIAKNIAQNTVTVSTDPAKTDTLSDTFEIDETNWISETPITEEIYQARFRYRQTLQKGRLVKQKNRGATFQFDEPQLIPPGQSLVLYDGETCLGGGIIK